MLFVYSVFAFAALHTLLVKGQLGPVPVDVGLQGGFYSPQTLSVAINNSVTFAFYGIAHSVTQSSFADPCNPLPGGFHSGFLGLGPNNSAPLKTWNLVVTNVSTPIWYFCAMTTPVFHCTNGMVGAINPGSQAEFASFSSAAKLVTTTASIGPTPILTGQGAFASSTPIVSIISVTSTSSTSSSSTSTSASTTSSTPSPSPTDTAAPSTTSNFVAVVGGTVGGGFVLIAFIISLWFFCMRKKQVPATVQDDNFFRYNPVPARRLNEGFAETVGPGSFNSATMLNTNASSIPTARLTAPVILDPPYLRRQGSPQSDINSPSPIASGRNFSELNDVDIRALAEQVAAVLAKNQPSQEPRGQISGQDHDDDANTLQSRSTNRPPNYRAATGPSSSGSQ